MSKAKTMRLLRYVIPALLGLLLTTAANAACPSSRLTNGTPADATQVMAWFDCKAPTDSPTFTGNAGIGTTTPAALLDLTGSSSTSMTADAIRFTDTGTPSGTRNWLIGNGAGVNYGDFAFLVSPTKGGTPYGPPVLELASSGNIGIGGGSPLAHLDVIGASSTTPTAVAIRFTDTASLTNARNWLFGNGAGPNYGDLAFIVSAVQGGSPTGTPVLNLSRSGIVSVNTANPYSGAKLQVNTGTDQNFAVLGPLGLSDGISLWSYNDAVSLAKGMTFSASQFYFATGKVGIGTTTPAQALEVNGQIKVDTLASASGTALCINANVLASCSSSRRYKENVESASFGLKEVLAMRPVTFKWKGRNERDIGLIAEEVAKINPLYATYKDGRIEGVKYSQLTAVLVNAVKELKAANDSQAARLTAQATEIARLRAQNAGLAGQLKQQALAVQDIRSRLGALERKAAVHTAENQPTSR